MKSSYTAPYELTIERLVPGGEGMGKWSDGRVAFVAGTVPGDLLRATRTLDKPGFVRVLDYELLQPSSSRTKPPCPVANQCGGCDWMMMSPAMQLRAKVDVLFQALSRTGRFARNELPELEVIESPRSLGYRSRIRLHVRNGKVGYFSRKSSTLVEFDSCLLASAQLAKVTDWFKQTCLDFPDEAAQLDQVELRALDPSEDAALHPETCSAHLLASPGNEAKLTSLRDALSRHLLVRIGSEMAPLQRLGVGGESKLVQLIAPGAFSQVNWAINHRMIARIVELAKERGAKNFLDIFCGSGNFSLPLLNAGMKGLGIEQSGEAVASAREGARAAGLNGEFLDGPAAQVLRRKAVRDRKFDLAIVDPPRAGAKDVIDPLLSMQVPTLVMIGCDPVTLARDLRRLCARGYRVQHLELYDMFPQTHHFESLAVVGIHSELP